MKNLLLWVLMLGLIFVNLPSQAQLEDVDGIDLIPLAKDEMKLYPGAVDAYESGKNMDPAELVRRLKTGEKMHAPVSVQRHFFDNTVRYYIATRAAVDQIKFGNVDQIDQYAYDNYGYWIPDLFVDWLDHPQDVYVRIVGPSGTFLSGGTAVENGEHKPYYRERGPYKKGDILPDGTEALEDEVHFGIRTSVLMPGDSLILKTEAVPTHSLICFNSMVGKLEFKTLPENLPDYVETVPNGTGGGFVGLTVEYVAVLQIQTVPVFTPINYCGNMWFSPCWGCGFFSPVCQGGGYYYNSTTVYETNNITNYYGNDQPVVVDIDIDNVNDVTVNNPTPIPNPDPDPIDGNPNLGQNGDSPGSGGDGDDDGPGGTPGNDGGGFAPGGWSGMALDDITSSDSSSKADFDTKAEQVVVSNQNVTSMDFFRERHREQVGQGNIKPLNDQEQDLYASIPSRPETVDRPETSPSQTQSRPSTGGFDTVRPTQPSRPSVNQDAQQPSRPETSPAEVRPSGVYETVDRPETSPAGVRPTTPQVISRPTQPSVSQPSRPVSTPALSRPAMTSPRGGGSMGGGRRGR